MNFKKRGSSSPSAGSAAALIGLITVILIFYILFIPPTEREKLLNDTVVEKSKELPRGFIEQDLLLKENPGRLEAVEEKEKEILIPKFLLKETKPDKVLREINAFVVRSALFSEQKKSVTFVTPEGLESSFLTFQTNKKYGTLIIKLNGHAVFEGKSKDSEIVKLNKELLQKENNLEFSVTGSWLQQKEYQLSDAKVIGTISEEAALVSSVPFRLSAGESGSFETGTLTFALTCDQIKVGILTVLLNTHQLYSAIPPCDDVVQIPIFKDQIKEERNLLVFKGAKGNYDFDQAKLKLKLSKTKSFVQYFELNSNTYADIVDDKFKRLKLEIDFVDDKTEKEVEVNLNGRFKIVEQKTPRFEWEISKEKDLLLKGRNYLELTPRKTTDIVEVRVKVLE